VYGYRRVAIGQGRRNRHLQTPESVKLRQCVSLKIILKGVRTIVQFPILPILMHEEIRTHHPPCCAAEPRMVARVVTGFPFVSLRPVVVAVVQSRFRGNSVSPNQIGEG
jgi:hypothetical protein